MHIQSSFRLVSQYLLSSLEASGLSTEVVDKKSRVVSKLSFRPFDIIPARFSETLKYSYSCFHGSIRGRVGNSTSNDPFRKRSNCSNESGNAPSSCSYTIASCAMFLRSVVTLTLSFECSLVRRGGTAMNRTITSAKVTNITSASALKLKCISYILGLPENSNTY